GFSRAGCLNCLGETPAASASATENGLAMTACGKGARHLPTPAMGQRMAQTTCSPLQLSTAVAELRVLAPRERAMGRQLSTRRAARADARWCYFFMPS